MTYLIGSDWEPALKLRIVAGELGSGRLGFRLRASCLSPLRDSFGVTRRRDILGDGLCGCGGIYAY